MTAPLITGFYAALLGLMLLALSAAVSRQRIRNKVSIGDGGVPSLSAAIRAHGNFVEYVPLTLLLILLLELAGVAAWGLHLLGAGLFVARALHGTGMSGGKGKPSFGRFWGTALGWLVLLAASVLLLVVTGRALLAA